MTLSGRLRTLFALGALLAFGAIHVHAQSASSGSVSGIVTDQQNAVVGGAEVKLIDNQTSTAHTTATNDQGRYSFANVAPGVYDIVASKQGFSQARVAAQTVEVGLALTVNVALQIGATSTTVEVQASAGAELQVLNSTVGSTISGASMLMLPNLGRDASSLSVLQVGVAPAGNVAGAASDQNVFQLDGGNNSDDMSGNQRDLHRAARYAGTASSGGVRRA